MRDRDMSLRAAVEHWFGSTPFRLTKFRNQFCRCICYVYAEAEAKRVGLYFFRHPDGTWRVFPPPPRRPAMRMPKWH